MHELLIGLDFNEYFEKDIICHWLLKCGKSILVSSKLTEILVQIGRPRFENPELDD